MSQHWFMTRTERMTQNIFLSVTNICSSIFKSAATIYENGTIFRTTKEGVDEVKAEFERLRELYNDDWDKVNEGLKVLYTSWPTDDERKSLARFTRVDEKGPYRNDGNINWPGGGGPMYDVIHPTTKKVCKKPVSGWRYPNLARLQEEIEKGHVVFGKDETTVPRVRMNLFETDKEVMRSVHFSYAQTATNEFTSIFDGKRVFDNPKSVSDIKRLVEYITAKDDNDIILDFFSGSATTAHALMLLNAEDGGNRRFIMVQLPEVCDEKSEAAKNGYPNICEIGKERIRRAGKKLAETGKELDVGFKVFRLDSSNLKLWDDTPIENDDLDSLFARMDGIIDNLKPDRSETDLIYEILLKMGYPLTADVTKIVVDGLTIYTVEQNCMLVCLQSGVTAELVEKMASLQPQKIVLSEIALADNSAMSNAYYLLENRGIELKIL